MLAHNGQPLSVRWVTSTDDLDAIVRLHQDAFPREHWTRSDVAAFARTTGVRTNVFKVLATPEAVLGTLLYSLVRGKDECQIRRVCVHPAYHRRGYGRLLIRKLIGGNSTIRRQHFTAKVEERAWRGMHLFSDPDLGFTMAATPYTEPSKADPALNNTGYRFHHFRPAPVRRILVGA